MDRTGERILIIDEGSDAQHTAALLEQKGYTTSVATSCENFQKAVPHALPDLILVALTDLDDPKLSINEKLKGIPEAADTPIIFTSAIADATLKVRAFESGGIDYLAKPLDAGELIARVRLHLDVRQQGKLTSLYLDHLEALVNQRTEELKRDNKHQEALNTLLELSLKQHSLSITLDKALKTLLSLPWANDNAGAALFLTSQEGALSLAAHRGVSNLADLNCAFRGKGERPCLECPRTDEVLHITPMNEKTLSASSAGLYKYACVPLFEHNEILGLMYLVMHAPHRFSTQERDFFIAASHTFGNIIRHKKAEEQLLFQVYFDHLTSLPNRRNLVRTINEERSRMNGDISSLCILDLTQFKIVNESMGYSVGDELLRAVSSRLTQIAGKGTFIARIGADVFAAYFPRIRNTGQAVAHARDLQRAFAQPFRIKSETIYLNSYIGIVKGTAEIDGETLLRDADTALHEAKLKGPGGRSVFDASMHVSAQKFMRIANDLRLALERNELTLYYQPLVDLKTGITRGAEALVRWNHPTLGLLPPDEFISIAEETGLIIPLGNFVLRRACEEYHALKTRIGKDLPFTLSVNLSGAQLGRSRFTSEVEDILKTTGMPADSLKLEVTETAVMKAPDIAREMLTRLRKLGITIAIDDFGTGYSSLSHLHSFPIDTLKIDRSFVSAITENGDEETEIIRAIIALGHSLGLNIIAEGIEIPAQRRLLHILQCEYGQGYFFSRPVPFDKFGE